MPRQAIHQALAAGWVVPPWGWPAAKKKTMPTSVRAGAGVLAGPEHADW